MSGESRKLHINQVGYRPGDQKRFIVDGANGPFEIVDARSGQTVLTGEAKGAMKDPMSGDTVAQGDFSALQQGGEYFIRMQGAGESHRFLISNTAYKDVKNALLKSFYFQRCGIELEERYAGAWAHKACHEAEGLVHGSDGEWLPSKGGWHDAGDYGKYTVPAAKAVADLLLAYEFFPGAFADTINIPESGNGVPDVLNEVRYELEFLFLLQRESDGAVYHKVTTKRFPSLACMPEDDTAELVFSPVSFTSAGTFAASMAMAARVYKPFDAAFASRCLAAAERAWAWMQTAPKEGFRNPSDIFTGEYGDKTVTDEHYWAAAELFRTTGAKAYRQAAETLADQAAFPLYDLGWANVGGYGSLALLLSASEGSVIQRLKEGWMERAELLLARSKADGYNSVLAESEYIWGSNMLVMNHAMHLIIAGRLSGYNRFIEAAENQWHYLLGRNALDLSYVTGFGDGAVRRPHHRPSVADGVDDPVPGMVAGGPNRNLQDEVAKRELQGQPPARCFVDHEGSYSTIEMAIYWNSPAVFVAAFFNS